MKKIKYLNKTKCAELYIPNRLSGSEISLKDFKKWMKENIPANAKNIIMRSGLDCGYDEAPDVYLQFSWEAK